MTTKLRAFLAAMAAGLALAGLSACATTRLEKPHLQVVDVDLIRGNLLQQELRVRLKVQNPNDRELPVKGVDYELELAGESFAHGVTANEFIVPALGETEFDVNVTANTAAALLKVLGGGQKLDEVGYRVLGKVHLAKGFVRTIPFNQEGTLKLR